MDLSCHCNNHICSISLCIHKNKQVRASRINDLRQMGRQIYLSLRTIIKIVNMIAILFFAAVTLIATLLIKPKSKKATRLLAIFIPLGSLVALVLFSAATVPSTYQGTAVGGGLLAAVLSGVIMNFVYLRKLGENPSSVPIVVLSFLLFIRIFYSLMQLV